MPSTTEFVNYWESNSEAAFVICIWSLIRGIECAHSLYLESNVVVDLVSNRIYEMTIVS